MTTPLDDMLDMNRQFRLSRSERERFENVCDALGLYTRTGSTHVDITLPIEDVEPFRFVILAGLEALRDESTYGA